MKTRLTLTIDKLILEKAKVYAKGKGISLSDLVGIYLESLTKNSKKGNISLKLSKIIGAVKLPDNYIDERELNDYLSSKHKI